MPPEQTQDAPQKYIRTFASDMEALKSGGTPTLAPFPKQVETQAPPAEPVPMPPPQEVPVPEEPIPMVQKESPLKTYEGDFMDRVKETGASTVTVLAAEQDAHVDTPPTESEPAPSKTNVIYGVGGGVLLVLALGGIYFAYTRYTAQSFSVPVVSNNEAPIVAEEHADISGAGKELLQQLEQAIARPLPSGSVRLLSLTSATSSSIFGSLPLSAPGALLRNINPSESIAGVINVGEQSPFFVLRVTSFGDTFSGMLQWEAHMSGDVKDLFPPHQSPPVPTSASTTPVASLGPQTPVFVDKTVANHDVRVLLDSSEREMLIYGYWNQRTLVIARNSATFTEILRRLAASRVYR